MKKFILFFVAVLCFQASDASHLAGAEIWYEYDTSLTYKVHLRLYSYCSGIAIGTSATVKVNSSTIATPIYITCDTIGTNIANNGGVVNPCFNNSCINPSSPVPGIYFHELEGSVTLPNPAADWTFSYELCCRNVSSNLIGLPATYVQTTLDNMVPVFTTPTINNGLRVPNLMPYYFAGNVNNTVSYAVTETDGDSLDYRLTAAMSSAGTNCSYAAPHTPANPLPNSTLSLDAQNGVLNVTPTVSGNYVLGIETREYRNGALIGSSIRDHEIIVLSGTSNAIPNLSGINNTTATTISINVCGTSNMNFTIHSNDADALDSTEILTIGIPSGASFTTNSAQNEIGTFNWTPTLADVRPQPYLLILEVKDNNCGKRQAVYQLYVNQCNTDSVWAGDANADFTCNNYDVLNIGLANNATGPVRAGATTNWQAEWCANWANNFLSNINQKHADCNGDGVVDGSDLIAVNINYGLVHTKTGNMGQYKTLGLPDLYCDMTNVQGHKGSTVTIPVMLGTSGSLMNDFYGISATVELLNAQTSAPISISKNTSWIGNASNSFSFEKSLTTNKAAFTFVRNDQQNVTAQQGQIGEITFPIDMASIVGSDVTVQFSDIKIIKNSGEEITDYNVLQNKLTILSPVGVNDVAKGFSVSVYPNPTKSNLTISLEVDKTQHYKIALYDVVGRLVNDNVYTGELSRGKHAINLDLSHNAVGQYQLEITNESGKTILPIQKR